MADLRTSIARLDAAYDPQINAAAQVEANAQAALQTLIAEKEAKRQAIIDYFKAVADKPVIDAIVANPPPETVNGVR